MIGDIWVFAEQKEGKVTETSQEVICEGKRIADQTKEKLVVVLMGDKIQAEAQSLSRFGVKIVFAADHESLASYRAELYTAILTGLIKEFNPGILLFGSTVVGQDLATRVAAKQRTSLVTDCDKIQITNDGEILQSRLMYQNKVHATFASPGARPLMVTVVQGIAKVKKFSPSDGFSINVVDPLNYFNLDAVRLTPPRFIKAPKTIDISEADFIVSGGKGAGDEAGFQKIRDLADALGAALAGSRVAVDNHWVGKERQIGQSGKTVSPEVMISCGISGASAHMFGMNDTQTLIAINKDKAAPIMKRADLGITGDLNEILPELIKQLKKRQ
jgi:electron transfer flavoprotein alpha subunit